MAGKRGGTSSSSQDDAVNKLILKKAVSKRTEHILAKAFISEKEVYSLVRNFFKKFLNVNYEFTHEELLRELRKVYLSPALQVKIDLLFQKISEIEHLSRTFTREELKQVLVTFKTVVNELIVEHYQKEGSLFRRLGDSIHNFFSKEHRKVLTPESQILTGDQTSIIKMNMLLDNSKRWSDKDIEKAKVSYAELLKIYNSLDEQKRNAYYKPVSELYNLIKTKERV